MRVPFDFVVTIVNTEIEVRGEAIESYTLSNPDEDDWLVEYHSVRIHGQLINEEGIDLLIKDIKLDIAVLRKLELDCTAEEEEYRITDMATGQVHSASKEYIDFRMHITICAAEVRSWPSWKRGTYKPVSGPYDIYGVNDDKVDVVAQPTITSKTVKYPSTPKKKKPVYCFYCNTNITAYTTTLWQETAKGNKQVCADCSAEISMQNRLTTFNR